MTFRPKPISELLFLVVDDEPEVRQTVIEYLTSFGFSYSMEAKDGVDAFKCLGLEPIDFVISDWEMPHMNGWQLLREIRGQDQFKDLPFVMITSPGSQERMKIGNAREEHVDAYIIKPFRSDVLKEKIYDVLQKRGMIPQNGVLVVDDEDGTRETIVDLLEVMGHGPIFQAHDGAEGLKILRENVGKIALVISDWEMPNMAGIDLLKTIREDPELQLTPFLMVTSQRSIEHLKLKQAIAFEVDHYLMKPFKLEDLREKVETVLKKAETDIGTARKFATAKLACNDKRWPIAERLFKDILVTHPDHIEASLGLASAYLHRLPAAGFEEAVFQLRRVMSINPRTEEAYVMLALAFESQLSLEKAIQCLREGIAACPLSAMIRFQLGRILVQRRKIREAMRELKAVAELDPSNTESKLLLDQLMKSEGIATLDEIESVLPKKK